MHKCSHVYTMPTLWERDWINNRGKNTISIQFHKKNYTHEVIFINILRSTWIFQEHWMWERTETKQCTLVDRRVLACTIEQKDTYLDLPSMNSPGQESYDYSFGCCFYPKWLAIGGAGIWTHNFPITPEPTWPFPHGPKICLKGDVENSEAMKSHCPSYYCMKWTATNTDKVPLGQGSRCPCFGEEQHTDS